MPFVARPRPDFLKPLDDPDRGLIEVLGKAYAATRHPPLSDTYYRDWRRHADKLQADLRALLSAPLKGDSLPAFLWGENRPSTLPLRTDQVSFHSAWMALNRSMTLQDGGLTTGWAGVTLFYFEAFHKAGALPLWKRFHEAVYEAVRLAA